MSNYAVAHSVMFHHFHSDAHPKGQGSINGQDFQVQYNLNSALGGVYGSGSYPSAIATSDYPYAFWIEHANQGADFGGQPYYSFDEFGWDGHSWLHLDVDPYYNDEKYFSTGSVSHGVDYTAAFPGLNHVSVVYNDLTRGGSYLFIAETYGSFLNFDEEILVVNPEHLGTHGYSSASAISMNDYGQGILGLIGILDGVDMETGICNPPASNTTCKKTPLIKLHRKKYT